MDNAFQIEQYETCWFEIKTINKSIMTRDREKFLKTSRTLSRMEEVRMYMLDKGVRKTRLFGE